MFDPARDAALMARVRDGDAVAFAELFDRYAPAVGKFLFHLGGDREKAADGVQEVFLRLWRGARLWADTGKFSTYLFQIAKNAWINELAKESRRIRPAPLAPRDGAEEGRASAVPDSRPGPEGELQAREAGEAVREAVASLPEKLRVAFVLCEFEGLKYAEAAEILEIPVGTVKSRMAAAEKALRKSLKRFAPPGGGNEGGNG
ncbi:MAG: sigma-70 family RNA polymerase sigma factor [Planctomycetes bacterium]|nr:sigma-70 family RNA polymerase sigma factor [Planctomycetota bacterium]